MEEETLKLLGQMNGTKVIPAAFAMRRAVATASQWRDGHTEIDFCALKTKSQREEIIAVWNDYRSEPQVLKLPSAPERPVVLYGGGGSSTAAFRCGHGCGHDYGRRTIAAMRRPGVESFTVLSHNHHPRSCRPRPC